MIDLDLKMELIMVHILVMRCAFVLVEPQPVVHFELWEDSHLVHMVVQM